MTKTNGPKGSRAANAANAANATNATNASSGSNGSNGSRNGARLQLRLYVAGNAPNSLRAIANCKAICDEHFANAFDLEIVDSFLDPDRALADGVIVTPTLLKVAPAPGQRLIGNLSDLKQVLQSLGGA